MYSQNSEMNLQPLPLRRSKAGLFSENEELYYNYLNRNTKYPIRHSKSSESIQKAQLSFPINKSKSEKNKYVKQHSI